MVKRLKPILSVMTKTIINIKVLAFLSLFALQGCEPGSEIILNDKIKAYHPFSITLTLKSDQTYANTHISARLFDKFNLENTYPVEVKEKQEEANQFNVNANNLGAGEYRLIVEVPYELKFLGLSFGEATKLITHDFRIHKNLPYVCFDFNTMEELKGWQSSLVYIENKEEAFSKPTCPGLFFVHNDWPASLKQTTLGGSMFVPVSSECFPKSSNQLSKQTHWTFSISSPELNENKDWQNIKSISFRIASSAMPVKISPEIHYQLAESKAGTFNTQKPKASYEISGEGWSVIQHPLDIPEGATVNKIELHVYGIPEQTVTEGINSIFFDGICPEYESTQTKPN